MIFVTGCDSKTFWQLEWFLENYKEHCKERLIIADFGLSKREKDSLDYEIIKVPVPDSKTKGWFAKPNTFLTLSQMDLGPVCWLDTDCEILSNPSGIKRYIEKGKITLVKDHPWCKRRKHISNWYNSGVVAFDGPSKLIKDWAVACNGLNLPGDQEILYYLLNTDPFIEINYISEAPHRYNVLRLDYQDNNVPKNVVINHWTGHKGKEKIKEMMREKINGKET